MSRLQTALGPPTRDQLDSARPSSSARAYWQLTLFARHVAILSLGIAALAIPQVGEQRTLVGALLLGVVLPYSLLIDRSFRKHGVVPTIMPFGDVTLAAAVPLLSAEAWPVVLLVVIGSSSINPLAFGTSRAALAGLYAIAMLSISGGLSLPAGEAVLGMVGFSVTLIMTGFGINAIAGGERGLRTRLTAMISDLDVIVWEVEVGASRFRYLSDAAAKVTGHPAGDLESLTYWFDVIHPDDRDEAWKRRTEAIAAGGNHEDEYRMIAPDGRVVWLHDVIRVESGADGKATRYRGVTIDVTDRKLVEQEVALYANLVENIQMALLVVRPDVERDELDLVAANPEAAAIIGSDRAAIIGQSLRSAMPLMDEGLRRRLLDLTEGSPAFDLDRVERLGANRDRVYSVHAFPLPGRSVGVCLDDVTDSAMASAALRRQALHDGLTGLPNRTLMRDRLQQALIEAERAGTHVALMLMDLDHFKEVNDALGHQYGDRLLVELSLRLQRTLREADTIARLGGDEFALLLTTNASGEGATRVSEKIGAALEEPFEIDGVTIQSKASIGVALYPEHADTADLLTQRADVAMYTAKRGGKGWAVYSPDHDKSSVERLTLLTGLKKAIEQDELDLYFQPVIDVATRQVVSCEALIRWNHKQYGHLNPSLIIELAELSGDILPLARWVARRAITTLAGWLEDGHDFSVAINLSVRNLYDRKLVAWLGELLDETGVPRERLKVELTESEIMDDPVQAIEVLGSLNDIGIKTSIDDFGTGYSSLQYLKRLPVTEIKIDQSFVRTMVTAEEDATIVNTVVQLSHNLGKTVLAEGVEDEVTLGRLAELGCDRAQGYLMGRPVPADEMLDVVEVWHAKNRPPGTRTC